MSKAGYIEQIEFKIQAHQKTVDALLNEIEKLRHAADVILELRGNDVGGPVVDITPRSSGQITIRKIGAPAQGAKPDRSQRRAARQELRQKIETCLTGSHPLTSAEIRQRLNMVGDQYNKTIWNTLYYMSKELNVLVHENGAYRLA